MLVTRPSPPGLKKRILALKHASTAQKLVTSACGCGTLCFPYKNVPLPKWRRFYCAEIGHELSRVHGAHQTETILLRRNMSRALACAWRSPDGDDPTARAHTATSSTACLDAYNRGRVLPDGSLTCFCDPSRLLKDEERILD